MTNSWHSPKTKVRVSAINRRGLHACDPIAPGELVAVRGGVVVSVREAARRNEAWGKFSLQLDAKAFLCPAAAADVPTVALYINHSCDPNVGLFGRRGFIAIRNIAVGEELTADYGMEHADPPLAMHCTCGSWHCRRWITHNAWRDERLQKRYAGYFTPYLADLIDQETARLVHPEQVV